VQSNEEVIQNAISQTQAAEISPTMVPAAKLPTEKPIEVPTMAPTWTPEPVCGVSSDLMPEWNTIVCDTFEDNQWGWYEGNAEDDLAIIDVSVDGGQYIIDVAGKPTSIEAASFNGSACNAQNFMASIDGK
jgi:hypothetical protein